MTISLVSNRGFTLIETVVIVGVMGILMVSITNILINSFRAKNRIEVSDKIEVDGSAALRELRENVLAASGVGVSCATDAAEIGSTLALVGLNDGVVTNLICYENSKIASESANGTFDLTSGSVKVTGCDDFARCIPDPDTNERIQLVNFFFRLSSGDSGGLSEGYRLRSFEQSVVPRN